MLVCSGEIAWHYSDDPKVEVLVQKWIDFNTGAVEWRSARCIGVRPHEPMKIEDFLAEYKKFDQEFKAANPWWKFW